MQEEARLAKKEHPRTHLPIQLIGPLLYAAIHASRDEVVEVLVHHGADLQTVILRHPLPGSDICFDVRSIAR